MRELTFMIEKISSDDKWHTFDLKGYHHNTEYSLQLLIKSDLASSDRFKLHKNAGKIIRKGPTSDNILQVLCQKMNLPHINRDSIKNEMVITSLFPTNGRLSNITEENTSCKGFLNDGKVEFYLYIQPQDGILAFCPKSDYEKGFIDYLCA